MDGTQVTCLLPQPSWVIAQVLWWSRLCSCCCSRLGSLSCTWPWKQLSKEPDTCGLWKRRAPREVLFGVFSFTALLFWTIFLRESCPVSSSSLRYLDASNRLKESLFSSQGNMALCTAIVIQSSLSGAANATVQNRVWKPLLSFIVSRLKSFLTTSAENKQLSGYWRVD